MGFFELPVSQEGSFPFLGQLYLFSELFGRNVFHFFLESPDELLDLFLGQRTRAILRGNLPAQGIFLNFQGDIRDLQLSRN